MGYDDLIYDDDELRIVLNRAKKLVKSCQCATIPNHLKNEYAIIQAHIGLGYLNIKRIHKLERLIKESNNE